MKQLLQGQSDDVPARVNSPLSGPEPTFFFFFKVCTVCLVFRTRLVNSKVHFGTLNALPSKKVLSFPETTPRVCFPMGKERVSRWASSLVHGLLSQGRQDGARVPFLRSLLCVSVVVRGGAGERGFPGWWVNQYRGIKNMAGEV